MLSNTSILRDSIPTQCPRRAGERGMSNHDRGVRESNSKIFSSKDMANSREDLQQYSN